MKIHQPGRIRWIILWIVLIASPIRAQDHEVYLLIPYIQGIVFDGIPDEQVWSDIEPLPLVQYEPNAGSPLTEKIEIRLAQDDSYFFLC